MSNVMKVERYESVSSEDVPNGTYKGAWSGYVVSVTIKGKDYRLTTTEGARGLNVPCKVKVKNGGISVEAAT